MCMYVMCVLLLLLRENCSGEDQYGVLAQYYSIPWLSYRDAVWHEYMAEAQGFKRLQIFPYEEERHPTPLGHRWVWLRS